MQGNVVQKTKFYFIILAAIMTLSLTYVMFKWGSSSKVYKITSHETHVHIQQMPAMDKPLKLPAVRHLEIRLTTTHKPGSESKPGHESKPGSGHKSKPGLESKVGPNSNNQRNETVSSHRSHKLKEEMSTTSKIARKSPFPSSSTTELPTTIRTSPDNTGTKVTQSVKVSEAKDDLATKTEALKTLPNIQINNTKERKDNQKAMKGTVHDINKNPNQVMTKSNKETEKKLNKSSNHTSSVQINHLETLRITPENHTNGQQIDDNAKKEQTNLLYINNEKTADIVEETSDQSSGAQNHSKSPVGKEKSAAARETEINKVTSTGMDKNTKKLDTEIDKIPQDIKEIEQTPNVSYKDLEKTNATLRQASTTVPSIKMSALNESFIEEKLLMNEYDPDIGEEIDNERKSDIQEIKHKETEQDPSIYSNTEKAIMVTKDNADKTNQDELQSEKHISKPTVTSVKPTATPVKPTATSINSISDDYNNRRRTVEERLRLIKEQLINRTIITDGEKVMLKERLQNIKTDNLQERNNKINRNDGLRNMGGPMNRYLQQRLRHLGFRNKMNPMFLNTNDNSANIDAILKGEGKTARPDTCRSCFKMDFRKIINEVNTCKGTDTDILILISTSPQNKDARDAIRESWCKSCREVNSKIKYLFVFGNSSSDSINAEIKEESNNNHDIIQIDFKDSYANLTYKTITGLKWANEYCENAKYVMKTDDDMFVNTELLPLLLKQLPSENFLGGFCWGPSQPHRDMNSKWYVPYQSYRGSRFPSMCSGTGYLLSSNIIPGILAASRNIPFFHLEDVYLAICLNKIGLHPTAIHGFNNEFTVYERCEYKNYVITSHRIEPGMMKYYWADSRLCEEERPSNTTFSLRDVF